MFRTVKVEIDGGDPDLQRKQIVSMLHSAAHRVERGDDSFYLYNENGNIAGEVVIRWEN